ncbi:MAG: sulfite oxidase [Acidobacteriota bacterium]
MSTAASRPAFTDPSWSTLDDLLRQATAGARDHERLARASQRFASADDALSGFGAGAEATRNGLFARGLVPTSWDEDEPARIPLDGKPRITALNPFPLNGEGEPHLLDDDITPIDCHFVRNNGTFPICDDPSGWRLSIDGEVDTPLSISLDELRSMPAVTHALMLECAGNGRAFFDPQARGEQWRRSAVSCSEWTGVPLRDLLQRAGLKDSAVYTGHYGLDDGVERHEPFSRGIPIDKALEPHTLVAYAMNGAPLEPIHGFPARLIVPGWIGSASQKWITRIWVRDREHDSQKMTGYTYRMPKSPTTPGVKPPKSDMEVATAWRIKSLITRPAGGQHQAVGQNVDVTGHAWAGEDQVDRVDISIDFGHTWQPTELTPGPTRYAWSRWRTEVSFPHKGEWEIWARATDHNGDTQPYIQPWNPKGYLGNIVHRLPVVVS